MPGSLAYPNQTFPTTSAQTTPFTAAEIVTIRRYAGYQAYGAFGYIFQTSMANLDLQLVNLSDAEQAVVRNYITNILPGLENAVIASGQNMGTDQAAVWTRNKNEMADRQRLYNLQRRAMCSFIGVLPGPALGNGGCGIVRT
jgi:hypothetical protein